VRPEHIPDGLSFYLPDGELHIVSPAIIQAFQVQGIPQFKWKIYAWPACLKEEFSPASMLREPLQFLEGLGQGCDPACREFS
jgi:hypothetical protein